VIRSDIIITDGDTGVDCLSILSNSKSAMKLKVLINVSIENDEGHISVFRISTFQDELVFLVFLQSTEISGTDIRGFIG